MELLVDLMEEHQEDHLLPEDAGDILQGVHRGLLEDLLGGIQEEAQHQEGEVLTQGIQDRVLAMVVLLVEWVAWIQVGGHWVC